MSQRDLFTGEVIPPKVNGRSPKLRKANGNNLSAQLAKQADEKMEVLLARIDSLEKTITSLRDLVTQQQPMKESYSTVEVASILGRKPYTVREWCRLQRINATKAMCGRGCEEEWRISSEELIRIQNEGLLPRPNKY